VRLVEGRLDDNSVSLSRAEAAKSRAGTASHHAGAHLKNAPIIPFDDPTSDAHTVRWSACNESETISSAAMNAKN
jgi:hypothetical protein